MYQESKYAIVTKGSEWNTSSYIFDRVLNVPRFQDMLGSWISQVSLTHSALNIFEKLILKKTKDVTLNGHISKTRTSIESRLSFSESLSNYFQNNVFGTFYTLEYTVGGSAPATLGSAISGTQGSKGYENATL